jgi:hypothetical protein
MENQKHGSIEQYFPQRAFGFIHSIEDGNLRRYFFHINDIIGGIPRIGASATFEINRARIIPGKSTLPACKVAIEPFVEVKS